MNDTPFSRIILIMKESTAGAKYKANERSKAHQCQAVTALVREVLEKHVAPDDLKKAYPTYEQYVPRLPNQKKDPLYFRLYRLMQLNLAGYGNPTAMQKLREGCELLKLAMEKNVKGLFHAAGKRREAIRRIDEEVERVAVEAAALKASKPKPSLPKLSKPPRRADFKEGEASVQLTTLMNEVYGLIALLGEADAAAPEFVEDHIWDEDYEKLLVVRQRERFVLKGDGRVVAYVVMETPLTGDAHLIRLGSDYWQDAKTVFDLQEDAFAITPFSHMREALAEIIDAVDQDFDFELDPAEAGSNDCYDTRISLCEKIAKLLA